jgi:hypothetical protein
MGTSNESNDKSQTTTSGGPNTGVAVAAIVVICAAAAPAVLLVLTTSILAYERRRVRVQWWIGWAATTFLLGLSFAGLSITTWAFWSGSFIAYLWYPRWGNGIAEDLSGWPGWVHDHSGISTVEMLWLQTWFGAPVGFALTAIVILVFRSYSRHLRGQIEGSEHSNRRPVGILDRRRGRIERQKISDGCYLETTKDR